MHVLLVKLTSIGDLIHALPAITDARRAIPDISFDWVIDKNFSEVALWHPGVKRIITTRHRQWRKNIFQSFKNGEIPQFFKSLRQEKYDIVLDGQSAMKSALITLLSRGSRRGLDRHSASEPWITPIAYQKSYFVDKNMHAIKRLRLLFSQALNYAYLDNPPDYGLDHYVFPTPKFALPSKYLVFVHNASWSSKLWPEKCWRRLIELVAVDGYQVLLPWGNQSEKQRADRVCAGFTQAQVLPFCSLSEHAHILRNSAGAICSDTGLGHLAAALNVPAITLYGATDPKLIGATGLNQQHLMSPLACTKCYQRECNYQGKKSVDAACFLEIKPEVVWDMFKKHLDQSQLSKSAFVVTSSV